MVLLFGKTKTRDREERSVRQRREKRATEKREASARLSKRRAKQSIGKKKRGKLEETETATERGKKFHWDKKKVCGASLFTEYAQAFISYCWVVFFGNCWFTFGKELTNKDFFRICNRMSEPER